MFSFLATGGTTTTAMHALARNQTVNDSPIRAAGVMVAAGAAIMVVAIVVGLAVVGRHGGGLIQGWDDTVQRWWIHHRSGLVGVSLVIAVLGDAVGLGIITVILTGLLLLARQRVRALIPLAAYLGGECIVFVTRQVVTRPRPPTANYPAPGAIPGVHETSFSYPSGHATAAVAVIVSLAGLAWLTWRVWWPWVVAVLVGMAVGTSRLVLGVHWFSDIAFGMCFGIPWAVVVTLALRDTTLPFWPFRAGDPVIRG